MRLVRTDADGHGETFELTGEALIVGRQTSRGQQIEHPTVSREHARFYVRDGIWQIADLNSSNGTFVNGAKVTKATLKAGDVVMLGSVELRFDAATQPTRANADDEINLEDDFFDAKKSTVPAPAAAPRPPVGPTLSTSAPSMAAPPAPKRLSMKNLERKSDTSSAGGVLQHDIAQYGGFMKLVIVTACVAAAYGLYLGTMKLTETVVPERSAVPADDAAPSDANATEGAEK